MPAPAPALCPQRPALRRRGAPPDTDRLVGEGIVEAFLAHGAPGAESLGQGDAVLGFLVGEEDSPGSAPTGRSLPPGKLSGLRLGTPEGNCVHGLHAHDSTAAVPALRGARNATLSTLTPEHRTRP